MKLSIVVLCWNDRALVSDCLASIRDAAQSTDYEIILSDNGSTDGSAEYVEARFPSVAVVRNGANIGYAAGNNAGLRQATGEYVLFLNSDTIVHGGALDTLVAFADERPQAGAFGCRVLNPDGSDQRPAVPLPTVAGSVMAALRLVWPGRLSEQLLGAAYPGWDGTTEREIGRQSGCCIMVRRDVLEELRGFDERFFYHFEETDLCFRIRKSGRTVVFCPDATITHLGSQSTGRFPIRFALETYRSQYRYFHKHYGRSGAAHIRRAVLLHLVLRRIGYGAMSLLERRKTLRQRCAMYDVALRWNWLLDPVRFAETGEEPDVGYLPLTAAFAPAHTPGSNHSASGLQPAGDAADE